MNDVALLITFAVLSTLFIFQQWYWSRQVHKLIDKLMSRNYAEYVLAQKPEAPLPSPKANLQQQEIDDELSLLNSTMAGMI